MLLWDCGGSGAAHARVARVAFEFGHNSNSRTGASALGLLMTVGGFLVEFQGIRSTLIVWGFFLDEVSSKLQHRIY